MFVGKEKKERNLVKSFKKYKKKIKSEKKIIKEKEKENREEESTRKQRLIRITRRCLEKKDRKKRPIKGM